LNYEDIIHSMPYGLERTALRLLVNHRGQANMVEREKLLEAIQNQPGMTEVDDRKMRLAIQALLPYLRERL